MPEGPPNMIMFQSLCSKCGDGNYFLTYIHHHDSWSPSFQRLVPGSNLYGHTVLIPGRSELDINTSKHPTSTLCRIQTEWPCFTIKTGG